MVSPDSLQIVLDLLSSNWLPANTDNKTPVFRKVTDQKRYEYNAGNDVVFAQRALPVIEPAGVGPSNKHEHDNFNLDIRSIGQADDTEQHWLNIIEEVKRILQANKINPLLQASDPSIPVSILEYDGQGTDLSNKTHNLFRQILPVQLIKYNVGR